MIMLINKFRKRYHRYINLSQGRNNIANKPEDFLTVNKIKKYLPHTQVSAYSLLGTLLYLHYHKSTFVKAFCGSLFETSFPLPPIGFTKHRGGLYVRTGSRWVCFRGEGGRPSSVGMKKNSHN